MCSWTLLFTLYLYVELKYSRRLLSSGVTDDDWSNYDVNSDDGWINGDIILIGNQQYHGLFDQKVNNTMDRISELSRNDIQLSLSGTLTMSFQLIFGCDVLNVTDIITINVGSTKQIFYWFDAYDYGYSTNNYPHKTSTFTINLFNTDRILYEECDQVPGDNTVWSINGTITSDITDANIPIPISFVSTFDYSIPYDNDEKYWVVTNIQFIVITNTDNTTGNDDKDNDKNHGIDTITIIAIVVVAVFLIIAIIFIIWFCKNKKKKNSHNDDKVEMTDNGLQLNWKYTVKGQKVTDRTQLKSAFDAPLSNNNNSLQNNNYEQQEQQPNIVPINNNNNNTNYNHPPSLPTIMGRPTSGIGIRNNNDNDSDEDSILRMQNKYAKENNQ